MRDRDQRLRWIEKLIGAVRQAPDRSNALVVPTRSGRVAIAFSHIEELVPAEGVKRIAFLPEEFCGVLHRGNELAPIVDVGGTDDETAHIVLVRGVGCLLGLLFRGTPSVVDLTETEHSILELPFEQPPTPGTLSLLDVESVIELLRTRD